ncbi:MAG TPA: nuclear transport factor 2 family protein [Usitatibacteraceae bacterium]|nr:nuclear transport factor 2 family protein [Usitatibacteraceae bacterium]
MSSERLQRVVRYWETLDLAAVERIGEVYAESASFRDPFNDVQGIDRLRPIFADMFERLIEPRFIIRETLEQGDAAFLVWDFTFRVRALEPSRLRTIHGGTHLKFAPDGRVAMHRDYWDAAGELYEQLPLVGTLMRYLKRRMG